MKHIIKILSVLSMCLCLVFGAAACNIHTHTFNMDKWESNETKHWHPATCEHTEQKSDEANHIDVDPEDGKCDVCQKELTSNPPPITHEHNYSQEWTSDETSHWHACDGCNEKGSLANHIDVDPEDGKCDVCQKELTSNPPATHEHKFSQEWTSDETSHWHACEDENCEQKDSLANHSDEDGNGICDECETKMPAVYTNAVNNIIDKIATEENFTFTVKATINGETHTYTFKFDDEGFDFPTFVISDTELTVKMRDNAIYIHRKDNVSVDETPILEKIVLPNELLALKADLASLITTVKEFIKTNILSGIDFSFLDLEKTENGYNLSYEGDLSETLNGILGIVAGVKDLTLNDIITTITGGIDVANIIESLLDPESPSYTMLQNLTVGGAIKLLDTVISGLDENMNIASLIDTVFDTIGISITPDDLHKALSRLGVELPAPTEEDTSIGIYLFNILTDTAEDAPIASVKIDDIIKEITGDPDATLISLLNSLVGILKTPLGNLLSFIPFDTIANMSFTSFNLSFALTTDDSYGLNSVDLAFDGEYTIDSVAHNLDFEGGIDITDKGTTQLDDLSDDFLALLDNNLKFAADNHLDDTIITTLVKALANKYLSGKIDFNELKGYYQKLVVLIKSQSINVSTLTSIGFDKSEPDEDGSYTLSLQLLDLIPVLDPLMEQVNAQITAPIRQPEDEGYDENKNTILDELNNAMASESKFEDPNDVPLLLSIASILTRNIDVSGNEILSQMGNTGLAVIVFALIPQLEMFFNDEEPESAMDMGQLIQMLTQFKAVGFIDTACDFLGVSVDTVYNFCKKYDNDLAAPDADEEISAYLTRLLTSNTDNYSTKLSEISLNTFLSDIIGSDFYTWYHNNITPLLSTLQFGTYEDFQNGKLDIEVLINVDKNNVVQSIEIAIVYDIDASYTLDDSSEFNKSEGPNPQKGKFTLISFSAAN